MKRIIALILLTVMLASAAPVFARGGSIDAKQTATRKQRHKHRRHHKNHHKGHIRPDPYPSVQ